MLNTLINHIFPIIGKQPITSITAPHVITALRPMKQKAIKNRKVFPTDDSAKKVVYLAVMDASKKWTMPIRNWKTALNRFMIAFEDRLKDYI